jgi:hypothetical protein
VDLASALGVAALIALRLSGAGRAPEAGAELRQHPCSDDPDLLQPATPGSTGVVVLTSAATYEGRVVAVGGGKLALKPSEGTGEIVFLPASEVRGLVEVVLSSDTLWSGGGVREVRVVLDGACVVGGHLVEAAPGTVALESPGLGRREFPDPQVKRIIPVRQAVARVEARERYLEAPSAMLMRAGTLRIASNEATHLMAVVGVTDFLSLEVGSALPVLYTEPYGANGQAAIRAGISVHRLLHLAAGAHASLSAGGYASVFLSGTITVGSPAGSLTVHAGPMFPGANQVGDFGEVGLALAGSVRTPWFDLVGESWVSKGLDGYDAWLALAGRVRGPRLVLDLGLATTSSRGQVLPWVGLSMDVIPWN